MKRRQERARKTLIREERYRDHRLARTRAVKAGDPSPEVLRSYIHAQTCWWCERSGFKSLGRHLNSHGMRGEEVRRMAGLVKKAPLCDPTYSVECGTRPQADASRLVAFKGWSEPRVMSEAGRAVNRGKLADYRESIGPEAVLKQQRDANALAAEMAKRPHYCTAGCGTLIPTAVPYTCSPECRKLVRKRTAVLSAATRLARNRSGRIPI